MAYGAEELDRLYGGSGGGGGTDDDQSREGAGGGGSGGAIKLAAPTVSIVGQVSAVGGVGGLDDGGGGVNKNDGGKGGDGRIRVDSPAFHWDAAGTILPEPSSSAAGAWTSPDGGLVIVAGESRNFHTDGYSKIVLDFLTIEEGGVLGASGSLPLVIEVMARLGRIVALHHRSSTS
jgi:hypothetical protein